MNIHALQTYAAVAEAHAIMAVPLQMVTPQSSSVLIGLVQDSLLGAYRMTRRDALLPRGRVLDLLMHVRYAARGPRGEYEADVMHGRGRAGAVCTEAHGLLDALAAAGRQGMLPCPAVLKGTTHGAGGETVVHGPLWTGKQVFSWLLPTAVSLVAGVRGGRDGPPSFLLAGVQPASGVMDEAEGVVEVRGGDLLCGRLCKATVGPVSGGLVQAVYRAHGPWAAAKFVSDAQRLLMHWLKQDTLCVSISDCLVGHEVEAAVDDLCGAAMGKADAILGVAGVAEDVREVRQARLLQEVMKGAGREVLARLEPRTNALVTIVNSGAKGTAMNLAQIGGLLGQQTIGGRRLQFRAGPLGRRTLSYWAPDDARPEALGFIASSFIMGLTPAEFYAHQMAGREGIVSTAVFTAEAGYTQRRMVTSQVGDAVAYDGSVRVSSNQLVQLHYGGDDYDATHCERVRTLDLLTEPHAALVARCCWAVDSDEAEDDAAPDAERARVIKARDALRALRLAAAPAVLPEEALAEIVLPVDLGALLARALSHASHAPHACHGGAAARAAAALSSLCAFLHDVHARLCGRAPPPATTPLDALLHGEGRGGDPSLVARLLLALQCTSKAVAPLSAGALEAALDTFRRQYVQGLVAPGEGVGAVGAASIGEPSTQMVLNTFHWTGIAEKSVSGLPRFKQLINGVDTFDTATMHLALEGEGLAEGALGARATASAAAAALVHTALSDVLRRATPQEGGAPPLVQALATAAAATAAASEAQAEALGRGPPPPPPSALASAASKRAALPRGRASAARRTCGGSVGLSGWHVELVLDADALMSRGVGVDGVGAALARCFGPEAVVVPSAPCSLTPSVWVFPVGTGQPASDRALADAITEVVPTLTVGGVPRLRRAAAAKDGRAVAANPDGALALGGRWGVTTIGSDLAGVARAGVPPLAACTDNVQEVLRVLGVSAAEVVLQAELQAVLSFDGGFVHPHHTALLASTMCRSGDVAALNRHKLEELGTSLLQRASFEQTLDVLQDAAVFGKRDGLGGATEKLMIGAPVSIGTGAFEVLDATAARASNAAVILPPLRKGKGKSKGKGKGNGKDEDKEAPPAELHDGSFVPPLRPSLAPPAPRTSSRWASAFALPAEGAPPPPSRTWSMALVRAVADVDPVLAAVRAAGVPLTVRAAIALSSVQALNALDAALSGARGWRRIVPWHSSTKTLTPSAQGTIATVAAADGTSHTDRRQHAHASLVLADAVCSVTAQEWLLPVVHGPVGVPPTAVVLRERKLYAGGEWTYALERSWSGASAREAEGARQRGRPACRVLLTSGSAALLTAAAAYHISSRLEALAQVLAAVE